MADASRQFLNRELSWLEFNARVLEEARDPGNRLLERVKFLGITGSNLDEFFMVRVGGLQQLLEEGQNRFDPAGLTTARQLGEISRRTHRLVADQYACLLEDLEPQLAAAGLRRLGADQLDPRQQQHIEQVFTHEVFPVITPIACRSAGRFPLLPGLGVNLLARLAPARRRARKARFAVIAIPRRVSRLVSLPAETGYAYVLLEEIVRAFVDRLFPGESVTECVPFRITRNADLSVREDLAGDLLSRMRQVLDARKRSAGVRLEIGATVSETCLGYLRGTLGVRGDAIYRIPGPLDLSAFRDLPRVPGFDRLKDEPWPPQPHPAVRRQTRMFETLARGDLLLLQPYDSFEPVIRLVEEAADDPDVLAIKQILYRTSKNSPIVAALARAAANGKHVTTVVELKARFDEARNIEWARELEREGVQVIYGLTGLKVHAKACLIVRREPGGIRRYVHLGTGNYNEVTARLYSDVSYLTARDDYGEDVSRFFNTITGYSQPVTYRRLFAAPIDLRSRLLELIESEMLRRQQGQPAAIIAKVNSLVDPEMIRALCKASQAGVTIHLNVRGICCLRPGVRGLSENITVTSIVDRYLEHARLIYFHHGGDGLVFLSSADWMPRNLDRRVELLVPVEDPAARQRIIGILQTCQRDNVKARQLRSDGSHTRVPPPARGAVRAQVVFQQEARAAARAAQRARRTTFEPQRPGQGRV